MSASASAGVSHPADDRTRTAGRRRVMDAAADLIVRQGYVETSLRDIAAAAGMKAGSVYYHFGSKDDLLTEILREGMAVMVEAFEAVAEQAVTDPAELVTAHVRAHLGALFEHGPYTAAHVVTFPRVPAVVRREVVPLRDGYEARWTDLFQRLVAEGHMVADIDIGLTRLALFGAMNSTVEWFDTSRANLDAVAAVVARQFWSGVSARAADVPRRRSPQGGR